MSAMCVEGSDRPPKYAAIYFVKGPVMFYKLALAACFVFVSILLLCFDHQLKFDLRSSNLGPGMLVNLTTSDLWTLKYLH